MNLAEYIEGALVSIAEGLTRANDSFGEPCPFHIVGGENGVIDFDVIIIAEDTDRRKLSGKLNAFKVCLGGDASKLSKNSIRHGIKFQVKPAETAKFNRVKHEETGDE